jgi:tetratricopeptide (TPR) repeat protein
MGIAPRRSGLVAAGLAVLTVVVFWPSCGNDFVNYDDPEYVTRNPHVQAGLTFASIGWALTTTDAANWHPLTWLSLEFDAQLFGINAFAFHLTNLLLHAAATALLFFFFASVTGALWRSASVAALFALHPLHVESVAWVAERKDVLSGVFWMLTMLAYAWHARRPSWRRLSVVTGVFAAGLLAKPMLVTLPCVLLLLDYWPLRRPGSWRRLVIEKSPLFALVLVSCVLTWYAQSTGGAVGSIEQYSLGVRAGNAVLSYGRYLQKCLWPFELAVHYPHQADISPAPVLLVGLLLAVVTALAFWGGRTWRYLPVGWLWYLGTLVPVIGLIQVGTQAFADRYTYIPLIGVFVLAVWGCADLAARRHAPKVLLGAGTLGLLAVCIVTTRLQLGHWHDSLTLLQHSLQVTGRNAAVEQNICAELLDRGELDESIAYCREMLRHDPHDALTHQNLGTALGKQGKLDEAIDHLQEAVRLNPKHAPAHVNLGIVLEKAGRFDPAYASMQEALRLDPEYPLTHLSLGAFLEKRGQKEKAYYHYHEALRLYPNSARAHFHLAGLLQRDGQIDEAVAHLHEALRLEPIFAKAHYNLGTILASRGNLDSAVYHFAEAARLDPDFAAAQFNLGTALKEQGHEQDALACFRRAVALEPRSVLFRLTLASLLAQVGHSEQAMQENQEALKLDARWPWNVGRTAWRMATHPQSAARNESKAVALAEQACQATHYGEPDLMDTLAAAYAASGRFDLAVATAQKALKIAQSHKQTDLVSSIGNRLGLYRDRKPFRDSTLR